MKDLYIIRKFVRADSVEDALKKEKDTKVSEVYVQDDWLKHKNERLIDKEIFNT